jgi:fibronectin type 3 domain-containing protein
VTLYAQWTPTQLSAPAGVSATAQSSNRINVSWSAVSGATNYDVYYEIGNSTTKNFAAAVSETSYAHTGLQASTTYYYYIKANNSAGSSGYSSYGYATTSSSSGSGGTTVPSAPAGVSATASAASPYVINLSWNAVSGATTYRIYSGSSSSNVTTLLFTVYAPTTSYMDNSNNPNSTRYYKVSAVNSAGEGAKSAAVSATTMGTTTKPSAPTGVSATSSGQPKGSVRVTWNAVSGATGYRVYYSTSPNGTYSLDGTSLSTAYTSAGWSGGGLAYFKVSAVNTAGESALSSYATAIVSQ